MDFQIFKIHSQVFPGVFYLPIYNYLPLEIMENCQHFFRINYSGSDHSVGKFILQDSRYANTKAVEYSFEEAMKKH